MTLVSVSWSAAPGTNCVLSVPSSLVHLAPRPPGCIPIHTVDTNWTISLSGSGSFRMSSSVVACTPPIVTLVTPWSVVSSKCIQKDFTMLGQSLLPWLILLPPVTSLSPSSSVIFSSSILVQSLHQSSLNLHGVDSGQSS